MKEKGNFYRQLAAEIQKKSRSANEKLNINETIRKLRDERKLSGVDLCRRSGSLDPRTLTAIEKGRIRNPSIETFQSIAKGLGVPISEIFRRAEEGETGLYYLGSQKGMFQIDFPAFGIKVVSFTPLVKELFCGKIIMGGRRRIDQTLLKHPLPIFVSTMIGHIEVTIEGRKTLLKEGDNLFFNGILRHSFYNSQERESVLMMVTAPSFL